MDENDRDLDAEFIEANEAMEEEWFCRPAAPPAREWTPFEIDALLPAPF
jgi:hypothetical protein